MAEGLDFYLLIYLSPKVIFLLHLQYLKDIFPMGSTSEANTNTFNHISCP